MKKVKLSYSRAKNLFKYESSTGNLIWAKRTSVRIKVGDKVGSPFGPPGKRYLQTSVDGNKMLVHRIIWLLHHKRMPKYEIGHEDGNGLNNRIENLRDITSSQNNQNLKLRNDNTSGVLGVTFHKMAKKWLVQSQLNGKYIYGGIFDSFEDAVKKRNSMSSELGFHKNHGREK